MEHWQVVFSRVQIWLNVRNMLACWPKVASRVMQGTVFFVCWSWISRCSLAVIFFRTEKQSIMSKRAQQSSKTEADKLGTKKPPERKANLFYRFGCFEQPGESKVGSEFCFMERQETCARQTTKTQQHILKRGNKMTIRFGAPGNWCGVVSVQVQGAPGNWGEVMTIKLKGPGWNSTLCRSLINDILRKSSRTCDKKSWISQIRHQYSIWRPMYWSGDDSCRQRWKLLFILDPWKFVKLQEHQLRGSQEFDLGT